MLSFVAWLVSLAAIDIAGTFATISSALNKPG